MESAKLGKESAKLGEESGKPREESAKLWARAMEPPANAGTMTASKIKQVIRK